MTGYAVHNPALESVFDDDGRPFLPVFKGGELDLDAHDRIEHTRTHQVRGDHYQHALELHRQMLDRTKMYEDHARVRDAEARYLLTVAHEHPHREREMHRLAGLLMAARQHGTYGTAEKVVRGDDGQLYVERTFKCEWFERAGLVKLCPDDARDEGMRVSAKYAPRIAEFHKAGFEVRYAVATFPNSPRGFLAADVRAIKQRVRDWILYARVDCKLAKSTRDPKRVFYGLKGVLATVEAPLSRRGDWNVHVNLILVFNGWPPYKELRESWGANIDFQKVPTGAVQAALRELVKYPLQAVSFKSAEKAAAGKSRAPPMIEWPTDAFLEWWDAHKRYRRTCAWGELFGNITDELSPWLPESYEALARMFLSPAAFRVERPMFDTTAIDERQAELWHRARDERQLDIMHAIEGDAEAELRRLMARAAFHSDSELAGETAAAVAAQVDLILGNKSAKNGSEEGGGVPPDTS